MQVFKRISLFLILFLVLAWQLLIYFVDEDLHIRQATRDMIYSDCAKIWSSRGFYDSRKEQNSLAALNRAFALGAKGVEIDFYYDVKSDRFIVSHDKPKKSKNGELIYQEKEGQLLTLESVFTQISLTQHFWLDYKNLDRLDENETKSAIKRLQFITEQTGFTRQVYIEGSNPLILSNYTRAGFHTILGIHPLPQSNWLSGLSISIYKLGYYFNDITALAMPYGELKDPTYNEQAADALSSIPLFVFHVPVDKDLVQSLLENQGVNVLLVGRDKSVNYFDLTRCSQ